MNKKSLENQTIIKALNKYGKVPEQWELLKLLDNSEKCIEQMNKKMLDLYELNLDYRTRNEKAIEYLKDNACYSDGDFCDDLYCGDCKDLLNILEKGE